MPKRKVTKAVELPPSKLFCENLNSEHCVPIPLPYEVLLRIHFYAGTVDFCNFIIGIGYPDDDYNSLAYVFRRIFIDALPDNDGTIWTFVQRIAMPPSSFYSIYLSEHAAVTKKDLTLMTKSFNSITVIHAPFIDFPCYFLKNLTKSFKALTELEIFFCGRHDAAVIHELTKIKSLSIYTYLPGKPFVHLSPTLLCHFLLAIQHRLCENFAFYAAPNQRFIISDEHIPRLKLKRLVLDATLLYIRQSENTSVDCHISSIIAPPLFFLKYGYPIDYSAVTCLYFTTECKHEYVFNSDLFPNLKKLHCSCCFFLTCKQPLLLESLHIYEAHEFPSKLQWRTVWKTLPKTLVSLSVHKGHLFAYDDKFLNLKCAHLSTFNHVLSPQDIISFLRASPSLCCLELRTAHFELSTIFWEHVFLNTRLKQIHILSKSNVLSTSHFEFQPHLTHITVLSEASAASVCRFLTWLRSKLRTGAVIAIGNCNSTYVYYCYVCEKAFRLGSDELYDPNDCVLMYACQKKMQWAYVPSVALSRAI